jgi:hypothetical protein
VLTHLFQIVQMAAVIVGLLALQAAVLYGLWWLTLCVVRFFPIVGKRHRHARWDELNDNRRDRTG